MFLIGFALVLLFFWFMINNLGGDLMFFTDPLTLIVILITVLGVVLATGSFKALYHGFRAVISPQAEISEEMRGRAATLFRLLSKTVAMASALLTLISLYNMLCSLDFTDINAIHYLPINLAATLIGPAYGLILIAGLFEPAVFALKKRHSGKR